MVEDGDRSAGLADPVALSVAVVAGLCGAVQPKINAELGVRLDSTLLAATINFAVALAAATVVLSRRPATRRRLRAVGRWAVPWWTYLAGLGGVGVVLAGVLTIERLGVAVFSVAFFSGQMTGGLLVDRAGISPGLPRPITRTRLLAVAIALLAVVLTQLGKPVGDLAVGLIGFVVGAGVGSALQSAFNARISSTLGDAMAATTVNVVVGLAALVGIAATGAAAGVIEGPQWPSEPWLYAGGLLGVTIVLSLAAASAAIGVLRTTLAMLAAQLVGAFVVDWIALDRPPTTGVLVGAALTVVAVLLVNRGALYSSQALRSTSAARQ